jgi:alpha-L-fucosidase 2
LGLWEARGDEGTGWAVAWKINFCAGLRDDDRAFKLIRPAVTS